MFCPVGKTQTAQGPVAAARATVAEEGVAHIVGGIFKAHARKTRAGAAARPGDGALRHSQVLQRGGIVRETGEKVLWLSAYVGKTTARQNLAVRLQHGGIDFTGGSPPRVRVERSARPVEGSSRASRPRVCPPML